MVILCGRAEQSPAPTGWGCKRTGLINQIFIRSVFMRSRVKRGDKIVLAYSYGGMQKGDTRDKRKIQR